MRHLLSFLGTVLLALPLTGAADEPSLAWVEQSQVLASQLGTELKGELGKALAAGGPVAAISVCRTKAPAIAARLSQESGAIVSRTALRVRNPANAPDSVQRTVLEQFASELASGKFTPPLEAVFEINSGGRIERRFLRAIPMEAVCSTCHGTQLAPDLAAAIARDYPADQATGFEPGQLRGAISVLWPPSPVSIPVR